MDQGRVLEDVIAWAAGDDNIRLVVVTGSFARGEEHVDPLSDLDLELYVRDPAPLLERHEWYRPFGEVLAIEALENAGWNPTRLIYYVNGKIDFMIGSVDALSDGVAYDREHRVLLDKDGLAGRLRLERATGSPPSQEEFERCVDWFAAAALMCAKSIVRDEPWMAKIRDEEVKATLLQMIEWGHRARYGWDYDTWYLGVRMRQWMDPDVQQALEACWAHFSLEDTRRGLVASIELFDRLCSRTAGTLGFRPFDAERVGAEVERILGLHPRDGGA